MIINNNDQLCAMLIQRNNQQFYDHNQHDTTCARGHKEQGGGWQATKFNIRPCIHKHA